MEIAKVTSKGQITIPQDIRRKMDLKAGDKIIFFEENGKFYFQNTASVALKTFQKAMTGEAKKAGFNDLDDVVQYIKKMRKSHVK
ncbi:putative transcriptional regulator [Treponema primitia ZAS-2]|uniref:Putative transcriptional regulator n=1 Tax=Treponema primitia (strain ATCC BAA-887 / DSM 12427 / ZAS-2) TaxID=545694 RepID=F5YR33_TREPZ|nr:AbrB/MazE/SpoVT family DNA-binding domain-containing protein [Treponema primitia]AEF85290.1 putative transcriptional regulator [Treponema primitia ZAS-2]